MSSEVLFKQHVGLYKNGKYSLSCHIPKQISNHAGLQDKDKLLMKYCPKSKVVTIDLSSEVIKYEDFKTLSEDPSERDS